MIPTVLFNCRRYLKPRPLRGYRHSTQSSAISTRTPVGIFTISPGVSVKLTGAKKSYPALPLVARFWQFNTFIYFPGSFLPAVLRRYLPSPSGTVPSLLYEILRFFSFFSPYACNTTRPTSLDFGTSITR